MRLPRAGLRSSSPSSTASSRIAASVSISLRIEAGPSGRSRPAAAIAQVGAGGERRAQLGRLLELVRLEGEAQLAVDRVEPVRGEERQQVADQPPAVVGLGVGVDRLVAEHAVDLAAQPRRRVLVEGRRDRFAGRRGGGSLGSHTPARTRASVLPSSVRAARSFQPPPQPHSQLGRSWSTTRWRLPAAGNRRRNARVPSSSLIVSKEPEACRGMRGRSPAETRDRSATTRPPPAPPSRRTAAGCGDVSIESPALSERKTLARSKRSRPRLPPRRTAWSSRACA